MSTKRLQFSENVVGEALPVTEMDPSKSRYERRMRERNAVEDFRKESFGLLKSHGAVSRQNTKLIGPTDITTIYNTWKNDASNYGGKKKTRKSRKTRKTRKTRKSRK